MRVAKYFHIAVALTASNRRHQANHQYRYQRMSPRAFYPWIRDTQHGCSRQLWLQLAKEREKSSPADVIPIYQKELEATVNKKNNSTYERGVELLRSIKKVMINTNGQAAFNQYLSQVRLTHKPKRNFMKLVDTLLQ